MRTREANERTGHAPRDRPTAISQVLPKCPCGCPSLPMKVLDACQLRKREEKERRGLTRRIQDRKRTRERERGGGKRNSWWGGTGGGWWATSSFFYLGEEWTRELGGAAPERHPPSISYSSSQDIDQNRCQDSDPVTCSPPMAAAQFFKHGRKASLSPPSLSSSGLHTLSRSSPSVATTSTTSRSSTIRFRRNPSSFSSRLRHTYPPKHPEQR